MVNTFVPSSGRLDAKYVLVGEQPGRTEVIRRQPFVGPAGENLDECLRNAGISRSECYFTNVIKTLDKPIKHYFPTLVGGKREKVEVSIDGELAIRELKSELVQTSANVIIPCGNVALYALTSRVGITNWRGSILESTLLDRKCIPTIHPATYTQEKLWKDPTAFLNKHLITMDLKKAKEQSIFPEIKLTSRRLHTKPNYATALEYLAKCKYFLESGCIVWFDIELTAFSQELSCISFAISEAECMCIPFVDERGDYFSPDQEAKLMQLIGEILENPRCSNGGQNVIFDAHFLLKKYGIRTIDLHDTMIAQKILYPEFRVGLNFITAMWTDIPYYKDDGKLWLDGIGSYAKGWEYNCLDSLSCAGAFALQMQELEEKGNLPTYERKRKLIEPLTYMMFHGIKVDKAGMLKEQASSLHELEELSEQFKSVTNGILYSSPKQLAQYFYITKGIQPYLEEGKITTNIRALHYMLKFPKVHQEVQLLLKLRKISKRLSTYLDLDKVDEDGRLRCSYNPVGTKFGRMSSSKNIFGTGMNLQNVPANVCEYLVADNDYIIYTLDLAQYENRIVAYVGNITPMIEVFESGRDSHKLTASLLFNKPYDEISDEPGSSKLGDGEHSERDWGKIGNHAFNYGLGYKRAAQYYEISTAEAKFLHDKVHQAYPGIENGYWAHIQSQLRKNREVENLMGRKVLFLGKWTDQLLHEAYCCLPQGTCADVIDERGIQFIYYNEDPIFKSVELLTQIHDSISIQMPLYIPIIDHAKVLIEIKKSLETPLNFRGRKFITPVDLNVNFSLNKHSGISLKKEKFSLNVDELAADLHNAIVSLNS